MKKPGWAYLLMMIRSPALIGSESPAPNHPTAAIVFTDYTIYEKHQRN
jgi:hypothetical protein